MTPQFAPLLAYTERQRNWARDVRLRLYTGLVLHFGAQHRALIIQECNRFTRWDEWALYQSSTRDLVKERVQEALKRVTQA